MNHIVDYINFSKYPILICLPMCYFMNIYDFLQVRTTFFLLLNICIRLFYPSCYYPASASINNFIGSPIIARFIAFFAEFCLYELWSVWINVDFWSTTYLYLIVLFGEIVSTIALLLQSEFLFIIEDVIWTFHTFYMMYLSSLLYSTKIGYNINLLYKSLFFGLFGYYLIYYHLPYRLEIMTTNFRNNKNIFVNKPLICNNIEIKECDKDEKLWVVPMLVGQAFLTAFIFYQLNYI